jgi:hypothetical protein
MIATTNRQRLERSREALNYNQKLWLTAKNESDKQIYLDTVLEFKKLLRRYKTLVSKEVSKSQLPLL